jgi:hypothetical protein
MKGWAMENTMNAERLSVTDPTDVLLVLLYAPGRSGKLAEPIDGTTRLQKLLFLLTQGRGPKSITERARGYGFRPHKMGPYSTDIRDDIEQLISAGLIVFDRLEYTLTDDEDEDASWEDDTYTRSQPRRVESLRYKLSSSMGMEIAKELWESMSNNEREALGEFKAFFNSISLRQLLIFVYSEYPRYAIKSEIRDKLGL